MAALLFLFAGLAVPVAGSPLETEYEWNGRHVVLRGGDVHEVTQSGARLEATFAGHHVVLAPGVALIDGERRGLPAASTLLLEVRGGRVVLRGEEGGGGAPVSIAGRTPPGSPASPVRFQPIGDPVGGAELFLGRVAGGSALSALRLSLPSLGALFDRGVEDMAGFGDEADRFLQATFVAHRSAVPVSGVLLARSDGSITRVVLGYVPAPRFPDAAAGLLERLARAVGLAESGSAAAVWRNGETHRSWQRIRLPDGSGSVSLPAGWRIASAHQGGVDIVGDAGELASLGVSLPVPTPEGAANPLTGQILPGAVAAYPGDPVSVLRGLAPRLAARLGASLEILRIVEAAPVASATGGRAAFVLYDARIQGRTVRALSLIDCSPVQAGWWVYYYSSVGAPPERFATVLPVLMRVWQSWSVDREVLLGRLESALKEMKETHRMLRGAGERRSAVLERGLIDWAEVFRGQRAVEDTRTGDLGFEAIGWVDETVRRLNEHEGHDRYRPVPLRRLLGYR